MRIKTLPLIRAVAGVCAFLVVCLFTLVLSSPVQAADNYRPMTPDQIDAEIDSFHEAGAKAYIIWQYSGYRTSAFGNDQYSFFRDIAPGPAICAKLAEKAAQYPDMLIGVNMWDLVTRDPGVIRDHLSWLKTDCGVKVIRTFAYPGAPENQVNLDGVSNVIQIIDELEMKLVLAIGDYSNGGGGIPKGTNRAWYASGYQGAYLTNANAVAARVRGHQGLWVLELANEPHCGGDAGAMDAYTNWITSMSQRLSGVRVGAGQVASDNVPGRCDNPTIGSDGTSEFGLSNAAPTVAAVSSHYYDGIQKANALIAASQAKGKDYYIGEAGWGGETESNKDDYYLYPIKGLDDETLTVEDKSKAIQNDLINQGYELSCTSPAFSIEGKFGGDTADFFQQGGSATLGVKSTQVFDLSNANYPIFRTSQDPTLTASLEDYWGVRNTTEEDPFMKNISSATMYRMMNPIDQCKAQVKMLEVVEAMCQKLKDPNTCALIEPIDGTNYAIGPANTLFGYSSLLTAWQSSGLTCEALHLTNLDTLPPAELAARKELKTALDNTPLYLDKAYRLGFLVITTELKNPDKPENGNIFFNFLRGLDKSAPAKHEVKVVAFKIPDAATNKYLDDPTTYDDPLIHARNAMLSLPEIERLKQKAADERNGFAAKVAAPPIKEPTAYPVSCADPPFCTSLNDPLTVALAGMVNTGGICQPSADDLRAEPVNDIKDSVSLSDNKEGGIFKPDFKLLDNLFTDPDQKAHPDVASFDFFSDITIQDGLNGPEDKTETHSYMIYPVGFDLHTVEDALAAIIYTDEEITAFKNNPENLKYYELLDAEIGVESEKPQHGFNDSDCIPADDTPPVDSVTGAENAADPCRRNVEAFVEVPETDLAPRVLGGWLGKITRNIQLALYQVGSAAHTYLLSCQTTEDFLLGRCTGGEQGNASNLSGTTSSSCINVWVDKETQARYAAELRQKLPGQQEKTPKFAGWLRYFGIKSHPEFQHIYGTCGGMKCYEYILNETLSRTDLNPYLVIGIAFNETGGLYSAKPDKVGPHFGCAPWRDETIEEKLECMIKTWDTYRSNGLDDDAAMSRYGYVSGQRNQNLNKIISMLSEFTYKGTCANNTDSDNNSPTNNNSSGTIDNAN